MNIRESGNITCSLLLFSLRLLTFKNGYLSLIKYVPVYIIIDQFMLSVCILSKKSSQHDALEKAGLG